MDDRKNQDAVRRSLVDDSIILEEQFSDGVVFSFGNNPSYAGMVWKGFGSFNDPRSESLGVKA